MLPGVSFRVKKMPRMKEIEGDKDARIQFVNGSCTCLCSYTPHIMKLQRSA